MEARPAIAVIGAGSWGQALALVASRTGRRVALWARSPDAVLDAAGVSRRLGGGIVLCPPVTITGRLPDPTEATLLAVPVQHLRPVLERLPGTSPLVVCCKGIEAATGALPTELAAALLPGRAIAVLSGPNFAREIAAGLPAASVLAAAGLAEAERLAALLATPAFRIYPGEDPRGCEIAGAAKNVVAIAAGVATGAGLGENARAALIARGLAEIGRLVRAEGGRPETVAGLAGAGDLILTCTGTASRNFRVGVGLGRGETLAEILAGRHDVAEGVATAPALVARAHARGVELPIAAMVSRLLDGAIGVTDAAETLLARSRQRE